MKRGMNIGDALEAPIEGEWGVTIKEDRNIIATFHYYTPFWFTHQGAGWVNPSPPVGKKWEGFNEQKQFIEDELDKAVNWAKKHGRQLFMGEFGAYSKKKLLSFFIAVAMSVALTLTACDKGDEAKLPTEGNANEVGDDKESEAGDGKEP